MGTPMYPMNGELYFYYAYTLERLGETEDMMEYYQKALDDGSQNTYIFAKLIDHYKALNDRENAEKALAMAKQKNPNNMEVRLLDIDYAYWTGDSMKAKNLLNQIDDHLLTTPDEMVNVANFFIKEKRYEDAERLLTRANAVSPNNFVILYNLGVCTYSLSERLFDQYNKAAISDPNSAQAKEFKEKSDECMNQSARYFEQARVLEPNDKSLLMTLRAIYARQQSPKYDEIDKLIQSLEK